MAVASVWRETRKESEVEVTAEGLRTCAGDVEAVLGLLGYAVDDPAPIPPAQRARWALAWEGDGALAWLGSLPNDARFGVVCWTSSGMPPWEAQGIDWSTWQERWAGRLWRRNRAWRGLLISREGDDARWRLTAICAPTRADQPELRHILIDPTALDALTLERLERLAVRPEDDSPWALAERLGRALDMRAVTRRFFEAVKRARARIAAAWRGVAPELSADDRASLALTLLGRLLVLHFIQRKGLLDGQRDYLQARLTRLRAASDRPSLYRALLAPLCLDALNTPEAKRTPAAKALGRIPYLNGGLFEPTALERACPDLDLPDATLDEVWDSVFAPYAFTTRDDGAGLGVDPEMLGRVFEGLMAPETRTHTGSFYTPRPLVRRLVHDALCAQLRAWGLSEDDAQTLLDPDAGRLGWSRARAERLLARLDDVAILDPACGSGAFLIGALDALERLHARLRVISGVPAPEPAALRRRLIARNLYGVDLQADAVRLCELRLWLAILDANAPGEPVAPLPNLELRVRQGDALIDPALGACTEAEWASARAAMCALDALRHRYTHARGSTRAYLRACLADAESDLIEAVLTHREHALRRRLDELERATHAPNLLGERRPPKALQQAHDDCAEALERVAREREALAGEGVRPYLSPALHFPEVMARGGFDMIVGNPPWVRTHAVHTARRAALRARYTAMRQAPWTGGGLLRKVGATGGQADLSVCFVERAIGLLRPDGVLAMWLPSKLARALYGGGLRRLLMTQCPPTRLIHTARAHFAGATTYPMALIARKRPAPSDAWVHVRPSLDAPPAPVSLRRLRLWGDDLAAPWRLAPTPSDAVFHTDHAPPACLAAHPRLELLRGVVTGCNAAFVVRDPDDALHAYTLPALRGADTRAWRANARDRLIWPHTRQAPYAPLSAPLPPPLTQALAPHRRRLLRRSELGAGQPWWRLFRVRAGLLGPKVAWRDIGQTLEAVALPGLRDGGPVPLNTVYCVPASGWPQALALAAWLNSSPARAQAASIAEHAANGYLRFLAWVVALLPMPEALAWALAAPERWAPATRRWDDLGALVALSARLHACPEDDAQLRPELDAHVAALYRAELPR